MNEQERLTGSNYRGKFLELRARRLDVADSEDGREELGLVMLALALILVDILHS